MINRKNISRVWKNNFLKGMKFKKVLSIQGVPKRYLAVLSNYIMTVPKLMVFDLDGCLWDPEMYELLGCGGSPFTLRPEDGNLVDKSGNRTELIGDVRKIMHGSVG